jgi:aspartate/methionine/tyrosine aminotransferase
MKNINLAVKNMPRSGIRLILDEASKYDNVLHLEIGQPNFPTPPHITQAAHQAALDGFTGYTPNAGYDSLREAFVNRLEVDQKIMISPERVVVSIGAMGALFNAFCVLVSKGDEVLVPDPGYPNYRMALQLVNAKPVSYKLGIRQDGFFIDTDVLRSLISKKTKAIVINSPSNPTGLVADRESIKKIVDIASECGVFIISDEAYDHIVFEGAHYSPLLYDQNDMVIAVYSCSKTYAMTGWRVGFVVAPPAISQLMSKIQEAYMACAPSVSQKAAEAALTGPQNLVEEMRSIYKKRRDLAIEHCEKLSIGFIKPSGAFYLMISLPEPLRNDSLQYSLSLIRDSKLAVAPGITFGNEGEGFIRIALCADEDSIIEGLYLLSKNFCKY